MLSSGAVKLLLNSQTVKASDGTPLLLFEKSNPLPLLLLHSTAGALREECGTLRSIASVADSPGARAEASVIV
jgi:hypothetical protein